MLHSTHWHYSSTFVHVHDLFTGWFSHSHSAMSPQRFEVHNRVLSQIF